MNTFVANFHDAVLLYATALREAVAEGGLQAKRNGSLIVRKMWGRTIQGEGAEIVMLFKKEISILECGGTVMLEKPLEIEGRCKFLFSPLLCLVKALYVKKLC